MSPLGTIRLIPVLVSIVMVNVVKWFQTGLFNQRNIGQWGRQRLPLAALTVAGVVGMGLPSVAAVTAGLVTGPIVEAPPTQTHLAQTDVPGGAELDMEGFLLYNQGRYQEALVVWEQLLELRQQALSPDDPLIATALNGVAEVNRVLGNFAIAEPLYQQALDIYSRSLPGDHPYVATTLNNLGLI